MSARKTYDISDFLLDRVAVRYGARISTDDLSVALTEYYGEYVPISLNVSAQFSAIGAVPILGWGGRGSIRNAELVA